MRLARVANWISLSRYDLPRSCHRRDPLRRFHQPARDPAGRGAGAAHLHACPAARPVLERGRDVRRSEQRRRQRHRRRPLVVGRSVVLDEARVLPGDDDLRAQARADDDGDGAGIRRRPRQGEQVLQQLLRLGLRLQRRRLERHPGRRLPRHGHVLVREPEGQGRALDAAQDLRADRQRVADVRRPDRRRQAGARLHHQGPVRLRDAGLEQADGSRGRSTRSRPTTSTATSRTAWASATSTATAGSICSRRTAGGSSRRRSPAIRSGSSTPSRSATAARRCTPTTSTATASTTSSPR